MHINHSCQKSKNDRKENIRRVAEVAKLYNMSGGIAITSFITPFEASRKRAREIIGDNYIEVYLDTPIEVCKQRDPKGLYKKVETGEISEFTGISSPFEVPKTPEITIDTNRCNVDEAVDLIIKYLEKKRIIKKIQ